MSRFLLLTTRTDDAAADDEHDALCRYAGLAPDQLHWVRVEAGPLPELDLTAYDGVLLGGSPFNVSDAVRSALQRRVEHELRALVREIVRRQVPFLGACYGIGILGTALGGTVDTTYAEQAGVAEIALTAAGRADPLLTDVSDPFHAIVGHKEACSRLPDGAVLLAGSAACPVQMFRVGAHAYATQFHPELDADSLAHRLAIYADDGYCAPSEAAGIVAEARRHDVSSVRQVLRAFVTRYGGPATR